MIHCSELLRGEGGSLSHLHYTKPKAPVIVWNLTPECNLSCRHCYADVGREQERSMLSTGEAKSFIDDLSHLNIPALLFSGGEPLLRKDIFELGAYAAGKGLYTALSTNGTLITQDVAKKIKIAGFKYVGVSIDGMREAHDDFRSSKGSYDLSVKGIENCIKEGIKTGARFTLTKYNHRDLTELLAFLVKKKIKRFCLYHLVYSENGRAERENDVDNKSRRKILDSFFSEVEKMADRGVDVEVLTVDNHADGIYLLHRIKTKDADSGSRAEKLISKASGCSAGRGIAAVDSQGVVHPCQFWSHVSLGNVKEKPFSEIWNDKQNEFLNMLRNGRDKLKGRCGRCVYKASCGGCRLRAERKFSDIWQEDPACYLTEEEILGKWQ
ncbi:MAG: radical SAM protein [Omnitrophica bacterium]|nr:radical SAM protein [Candidatus Omnitrophota bacterium]